jgi:type IV secretory pathway TraG/TraD family ATPase VirD4
MDIKLFYRQADYKTARDIAESLGYRSAFARSHTLRDGQAATEGLSEQAVHVLTPRDINELAPDQVIALYSNRKPIWLKRMDWQEYPTLKKRRAIPPPPVEPLPPLASPDLSDARHDQSNHHLSADRQNATNGTTLWQSKRKLPNGYVDPDKRF